mgnify:CR=1 FL=1
MAGRYAVYYVPHFQSRLYRLGSTLLGRCVDTGKPLPRPDLKSVSAEELALRTRRAWLYGFHGTIVAPFETDFDEADLSSALNLIVRDFAPFALSGLRLTIMDGSFMAIEPVFMPEELQALERQCVMSFNRFRRPLGESDLVRREPLPPKLRNNLIRWGYHLVFDEFKFHLTLTDSLPERPEFFLAEVRSYLGPILDQPLIFDRLALFHQPSRTEPFICRQVFLKDAENEH